MAQYAAESENSSYVAPAIANPGPLGLCGFALTTFVLSAINAGWFSAGATTIVVGLALFYGGAAQFCAGMWEFKTGNTFGATAFTSYGAFWLSFAAILLPGTGVLDALVKAGAVESALGLYLLAWGIFTAIMFLGTLKSNMALIGVFGFLTLTFLSLAIGHLSGASALITLGGYLGIITAIVAWYTALAGLLSSGKSAFTLPVGPIA
ncbi:MAG: acetate uptake transporter [Ktedonobacteraceae bacterium]|nr:acetate uptake transporter [Ktedonobacteraceae bacterium]